MSEKVTVEFPNHHQVAVNMATQILFNIERKKWEQISRDEYLKTVAQCSDALRGIAP